MRGKPLIVPSENSGPTSTNLLSPATLSYALLPSARPEAHDNGAKGMNVDRDRWNGWVSFTWILAGLAILASIFLIVNLGTVHVPKATLYGTTRYEDQPNIMIWAIGIGQSVGALLLAVLFSMVNSIYKNSCDAIRPVEQVKPSDGPEAVQAAKETVGDGVRLTSVPEGNPLRGILHAGDIVHAVNGKPVSRFVEAKRAILTGPNSFAYRDLRGQEKEVTVEIGLNHFSKLEGESVSQV